MASGTDFLKALLMTLVTAERRQSGDANPYSLKPLSAQQRVYRSGHLWRAGRGRSRSNGAQMLKSRLRANFRSIAIAQPHKHAARSRVDLSHEGHLVVAFSDVILIDANCVDPKNPLDPAVSETAEGAMQILGDG